MLSLFSGILGCKGTSAEPKKTAASSLCTPALPAGGVATVCATENGYEPSSMEVKKGTPLRIRFIRTTNSTCATEVISADPKIDQSLPELGKPVEVEIPTNVAREITLSCSMKMFHTKIRVTE